MNGLQGVDVASFQGPPSTWAPKAGNIAFAAVKISELSAGGPYVNPDAAADWAYLGSKGLGRIGYLFGHPAMSAGATVTLFMDTLRSLGFSDGDMVALDLEVSDGLTPGAVAGWAADVLRRLKALLDREVLLYTFTAFAQEGNCAGLGAYPLWIAGPSSPPGRPFVPPPWRRHTIHQYKFGSSSDPLDRDLANYASLKAMQRSLGKHVPKPTPKPRRREPMQLPQVLSYVSVSIPAGVKHVLLSAGANAATLKYQFLPGGTWTPLTLVAQDGASVVAVPAKATQLRVQRSETAESIDVALQDS